MNNSNTNGGTSNQNSKSKEIFRNGEMKAVKAIEECFKRKIADKVWYSLYSIHRDIVLKDSVELFLYLVKSLIDDRTVDGNIEIEIKNIKLDIIFKVMEREFASLPKIYTKEDYLKFFNIAIKDGLRYQAEVYAYYLDNCQQTNED